MPSDDDFVVTPWEVKGDVDYAKLVKQFGTELIDDKMLKKMEKCLEDLKKVVEQDDPIGYSKLDFNFHAMIYGASGNPFLQEILESIKNKMRPLVPLDKPSLTRGYKEHKMILEALRSKDMHRAEKALQQHNLGMQIEIQKGVRRGKQVH